MNCCQSFAGTDRFFSKHSHRYAKRFRKKGPDKTSRILIAELSRTGIATKTVLDIGCGVGDVHLSLLEQGASMALGIDLSQGMLDQAAKLAKERGIDHRVRYVHGDLATTSDPIDPADIVVLDKVLCCYADPEALLRESTGKAKSYLALSYPRASWTAAAGFRFLGWLGRILGWSFHPYYHEPSFLEQTIVRSGFVEMFSAETIIWQLKIYARA